MAETIPKDALAPKDAAEKFGLSWSALRKAIGRKRIAPFKYGSRWYVTARSVKKYLNSRYLDSSSEK
ncbi:MAG: helix-turn-helix domain-containing protein [Candidatus Omnitrophota bacterium]